MAKKNHIFERREKKYRLTLDQFQHVYAALQEHMHVDAYGIHTICSLYYDTEDYHLIRTSNEKPVYKEKFRLRSYGTPGDESTVFLELKKKYDGVVYKRRASLNMDLAQKYMTYGNLSVLKEDPNQIMMEIDWVMKRYQLVPKVIVAYDRIALFGKADSQFRVTFDFDIRWRDDDLDLRCGDYGYPLIGDKECAMEVKALGALPTWMTTILSEKKLYSTSFSKYGIIYKQFIAQKQRGSESLSYSLLSSDVHFRMKKNNITKGATYNVR